MNKHLDLSQQTSLELVLHSVMGQMYFQLFLNQVIDLSLLKECV